VNAVLICCSFSRITEGFTCRMLLVVGQAGRPLQLSCQFLDSEWRLGFLSQQLVEACAYFETFCIIYVLIPHPTFTPFIMGWLNSKICVSSPEGSFFPRVAPNSTPPAVGGGGCSMTVCRGIDRTRLASRTMPRTWPGVDLSSLTWLRYRGKRSMRKSWNMLIWMAQTQGTFSK
jgi:hypothetical protein